MEGYTNETFHISYSITYINYDMTIISAIVNNE